MGDRPQFRFQSLGNWSGALLLAAGLFLPSSPTLAQAPGPEVCAGCHEAAVAYYQKSVHGQKGNGRGPAGHGDCATCHGDGTEHVKAGGGRGVGGIKNPGGKSASMSADDKNALCMTCHAGGSARTHWDTSTHRERGNACTSCHTMHTRDLVLTKVTQPQVCFTCHKQQRVDVNRMFRHPILEGKVACSDCHNPHGTVADSMLKVRPPFLCHSCHTPHGGVVPSLRGQAGPAAPAAPPAPFTGKSAVALTQGRGCLNCHTQIHGGNNPALGAPTPQFMLR